MIFMIVFLFSVAVAMGTGVMAGISDFRGLTIPNLYQVIVAGSFALAALAVWLSGADIFAPPLRHLAAAATVFAITFLMFHLKMMGGGDSKMLTVYALWTGFVGLPPLLFYTAVAGSVLGVVALIIKRKKPFKNPPPQSWLGRLQAGESRVPYGIPIALGAFAAFASLGYFSPETLSKFLTAGGL